MAYSIRCPACRKKFPWDPTKGFPDECPNHECVTRIAHDRADDDVVMPFVRSSTRTKATDQVYRDMERGSEVRAQAAADMAGVPVSEMSDLKITDLRPTTRAGDVAAAPVNNAVSQHMAMMQQRGMPVGFGAGANASEYGGAVQTGPHPNAGARARTALHQHHERLTGGVATSDRPASEVNQPGYRIRG